LKPPDLEVRLRVGEAVIREAGRLAMDYFNRRADLAVTRKGAQDLVSEADRACEDLIVRRLSALFPDDGFLGEEGGSRGADRGGPLWIIDPIDGTHNFLTGVPFWCLSIGLHFEGRALIGLIYHPAENDLFSASAGGGAFLNARPIRVSGETELTHARVCVGFSYRAPVAPHVGAVERLLSARCEYLRLGSGALGVAYVAAGRFDAYWERHINSWDVAAGLVLVSEAGGWINDFWAGDGLRKGNEILASTPALKDQLIELVAFNR
jgi:myo-inositol-1(or 4)-monophosphatase